MELFNKDNDLTRLTAELATNMNNSEFLSKFSFKHINYSPLELFNKIKSRFDIHQLLDSKESENELYGIFLFASDKTPIYTLISKDRGVDYIRKNFTDINLAFEEKIKLWAHCHVVKLNK